MIGKLRGVIDGYGEDWVIVDVGGVGYQVFCSTRTLQALPPAGRGRGAVDRDLCARGHHPALRLFRRPRPRMVPAAPDRAGRRRQGRARHPRGAEARRSRDGDRAPGQGDAVAGARRRQEGRRAHRRRTPRQGAGLCQRRSGRGQPPGRPRRAPRAGAGRRCGLGAGQSRLRPDPGKRRDRRRAAVGGRGGDHRSS